MIKKEIEAGVSRSKGEFVMEKREPLICSVIALLAIGLVY